MLSWSIYDGRGQRKYLNEPERQSFLLSAAKRDIHIHSFCWTLAVSGCRISEGLALSGQSIDFSSGHVILECLKKRGKKVFRTVPLPAELLALLKERIVALGSLDERLWPWSRQTGYRRIKEIMREARVVGPHATPRGLRHAFGVSAIQSNVPLNLLQRWLGHADVKTTAIYANAMGPEEREFASRTWNPGVPTRKKKWVSRKSPTLTETEAVCERQSSFARFGPFTQEVQRGPSEKATAGTGASLLKLAILLNDRILRMINTSPPVAEREAVVLSTCAA